jgi:hypothetical protein
MLSTVHMKMTDVSEELIVLVTLMMEAVRSSETSL